MINVVGLGYLMNGPNAVDYRPTPYNDDDDRPNKRKHMKNFNSDYSDWLYFLLPKDAFETKFYIQKQHATNDIYKKIHYQNPKKNNPVN